MSRLSVRRAERDGVAAGSTISSGAEARSWEPLAAALAYVAFICWAGPWWSAYELSTDEGINLMKAALVANGYALYDPVWSDQPPVFTLLLALLHRSLGFNVAAARSLVLVFSALLIISLFRLAARSAGRRGAWSAVVVLMSAGLFQTLSICVAIGLPALALALGAMDVALSGCDRGKLRLIAWAGVLFGLSAQVKLFTLMVLPAIGVAVASGGARRPVAGRVSWLGLATFLAPATVVFVILTWISGDGLYQQLIEPHLKAQDAFSERGGVGELGGFLVRLAPVPALLGVAGLAVAWRKRARERWVLLLWVGVSTLVLLEHRPLWNHHPLIVVVPLSWACAYVVPPVLAACLGEGMPASSWRAICCRTIAAALTVAALHFSSRATVSFLREETSIEDRRAFDAIARFASATRWVVTDRPIDAYRNELLVPPPLAVFSDKRLRTGNLSDSVLLESLQEYEPEQICFRRFQPSERVVNLLPARYVAVGGEAARHHYVSRRLLDTAAPAPRN